MTARKFITDFLKDGFLYFWFALVLSLVYAMTATPIVAPILTRLEPLVGYNGFNMLTSLVCWLVVTGLMMLLEYKRGYWETRVGYFHIGWAAVQKLCSMLFMLIPLLFSHKFFSAYSSILAYPYRGFLWPDTLFSFLSGWLRSAVCLVFVGGITFACVMAAFYAGRKKFVALYVKRSGGRYPNQHYGPTPPASLPEDPA